jgi:tetratricopeptide (TPR) repeat protein
MDIMLRIHTMFSSTHGKLIFILFVILITLTITYIFLRLKQKTTDLLAYRHHAYYDKAKKLILDYTDVGRNHADILGRQSIVQCDDDSYALCTIPPPSMLTKVSLERFQRYHQAIHHLSLPLFTHYVHVHADSGVLITIERDLIHRDKHPLPTLQEYLLDKSFTDADAELILLEITRALATLHELTTSSGERLYYGLLLPRYISLHLDSTRRIDKIVLAHHGLAFAIGPQHIHSRLTTIRDGGDTAIDKQYLQELQEHYHLLAPELRSETRLHEVGPSSDFYAFATLAITLFTGAVFTNDKDIAWASIPRPWHSFLQACLHDTPGQRPKDFLELEDRLYDPDIALTAHNETTAADATADTTESISSLDDLTAMLRTATSNKSKEKDSGGGTSPTFSRFLTAGNKSLRTGKWSTAKKYLQQAYDLEPHDSNVNVGLAIVYYEEGEIKKAEKFYTIAKKDDPTIAKRFREHIAFRV